ncbi:MAG: hypothetical protein AAF218_09430 [Pseudomonadota bacterium]
MLRFLVLGLLIFCGLARPAAAEAMPAGLLADQTLLVHRLTKSACLVLSGAAPDVHMLDIERSAAAMLQGFADLEQIADVHSQSLLANARRDGETLAQAASQIAAGDRHSVAVGLLLRNAPLVAARLSALPVAQRDETDRTGETAHNLRVRTQRLQRDLCLLRIGLAGTRAQVRLQRDLDRVPQLLNDLLSGNAARQIGPPPSVQVKVLYGKAAAKWKTLSGVVSDAALARQLGLSDVQIGSVLVDGMLNDLDRALALITDG